MKTKNAGLAVLLGAIIPGAGHLYVGKIPAGAWYLALYFLIFPCIVGAWTGYTSASARNEPSSGFFMIVAVIAVIVWLYSLYSVYADARCFNEKKSGEYKRCPYCAEMIEVEATICPYCQQSV